MKSIPILFVLAATVLVIVLLSIPAQAATTAALLPQPAPLSEPQPAAATLQSSQNVELIGQIWGDSYAVTVSGDLAYVGIGSYLNVAYGYRLVIINIADPGHPVAIGQTSPLPGHVQGVAVAGNYAYIAADTEGLRIVNVANPAAPTAVGHYGTPGSANDVVIVGTYAYVAAGFGGLRVINVANPTAPVEIGFVVFHDTPGEPGYASGVAVAGTYAYIADWYGLRIINVANPAAPTQVGFYTTPRDTNDMVAVGSFAYVAAGSYGLRIINISNPDMPTQVGSYDTPGNANGVAVAGSCAYVADGFGGLRVINVANPAVPTQVGFYDTPVYANDIAAAGGYAYVADSGGIVILRFTGELTVTPTRTTTPTPTESSTRTTTPTQPASPPTKTPSASVTRTPSSTGEPSQTPTRTQTPTPTHTNTPTLTHTPMTEHIVAPFTLSGGVTTSGEYSGLVHLDITGIGQAAGPIYNDAFYVFADSGGNPLPYRESECSHPLRSSLLHASFGGDSRLVEGSGRPLNEFVVHIDGVGSVPMGTCPPYRDDHHYSVIVDLGGRRGPITLGTGDGGVYDNTGAFVIDLTSVSSITPSPTETSTATATSTGTATLAQTPTMMATPTPTTTMTPSATPTATGTNTQTATATATSTRTATLTPTSTFTNTVTPTPTRTPTSTPTETATPTLTASATATRTATASRTVPATSTATATILPTWTPPPAPFSGILINAGGPDYTDQAGSLWRADRQAGAGSWGYYGEGGTYADTSGHDIQGTADDDLFRSERWWLPTGPGGGYRFDLPNGRYEIALRFAEVYCWDAGQRVFDVHINGETVIDNLDLFAQYGQWAAHEFLFERDVITGTLDISLTGTGTQHGPALKAIRVTGIPATMTPTATPSATPSPTFTATATTTPTETPTATPTSCIDVYEPDDTRPQAAPITPGAPPQHHSLYFAGDRDWSVFSALPGNTYVMRTLNLGAEVDTVLCLYDSASLTPILCDDDGGSESRASQITYSFAEAGTYYTMVNDRNPAIAGCNKTYEIGITLTPFTPTSTATVTATPSALPTETAIPTATETNTPTSTATTTPTATHWRIWLPIVIGDE